MKNFEIVNNFDECFKNNYLYKTVEVLAKKTLCRSSSYLFMPWRDPPDLILKTK